MAFPGNVNRYVVSGTLPGGEAFAFGFYGEATDPSVTMQSLADTIVGNSLFTAFIAAAKSVLRGSYTTVRTYRYASGTAAVDSGQANIASGTGSGGADLPNPTSLAITLRTAVASRRGRGRVFIPVNGGGMATGTGLFASGTINPIISTFGAWADNLNARVVSERDSTSRPVVRVDADYRPDHVEGRESRLTSPRFGYTFV